MNDSVQRRSSGGGLLGSLLIAGVVVAGLLLYRELPSIKRYLRMERM